MDKVLKSILAVAALLTFALSFATVGIVKTLVENKDGLIYPHPSFQEIDLGERILVDLEPVIIIMMVVGMSIIAVFGFMGCLFTFKESVFLFRCLSIFTAIMMIIDVSAIGRGIHLQ